MISLYNKSEYEDTLKEKCRQTKIFWSVFACALALDIAVFLLKVFLLPWDKNMSWGGGAVYFYIANVLITLFLVTFWLVYRGIKLRVTSAYVPLLFSVTHNEVKPSEGIYLRTSKELIDRGGIKFFEMFLYEGDDVKGRSIVGRILLDESRGLLNIERGDKICYKACDKVLFEYEILKKHAVTEEEAQAFEDILKEKTELQTEGV